MVKSKIKIKEIKKKIKVTEIVKEPEESLEEIVNLEEDSQLIPESQTTHNSPSLTQHLDSIPSQQDDRKISTANAATRSEREASTAVNYATSQTTTRRSYSSAIRASGNVSPQSQVAAERINPIMNPSGAIIEQTNRNKFDLNRENSLVGNVEPSLRKFNEENDRDYEIDNSRKYESRKNKMM